MVSASDRLAVAYHEAGHAVVLRLLKRALRSVKIYWDAAKQEYRGHTLPETVGEARDEAAACVAGFAAECRYLSIASSGRVVLSWQDFLDADRYGKDRTRAWKAMQRFLGPESDDETDDNALDDLVRCELERTKTLLADAAHWRAIQTLAKRLNDEGCVSGEDAMTLIDGEISQSGHGDR
jgi:hypothetical protein